MKIPQFQYFGKWQSNYCDDLRRPRRDAPAALQLPENSSLTTLEPVKDAIRTFTIFHGWVRTIQRSCPFLQSQKILNRHPQLYHTLHAILSGNMNERYVRLL